MSQLAFQFPATERICRNCRMPYGDNLVAWPHHCCSDCRAQHLGLIPPWCARELTPEEESRWSELNEPGNPEALAIFRELPIA